MQLTSLITPSPTWLSQCQSHLRQTTSSSNNDQLIFDQILFSDLRDVVSNDSNAESNSGSSRTSKLLRDKIEESKSVGKSIVELTLLVQLEECVDVSLNAESVLGDSNSNGGRNNRIHKMILSDGHTTKNNATNSTLLAMETTPIFSLHASPPGTKLLLFNSITIRHGILQLHSGNTLILGGKIQKWQILAEEKREKQKKLRGMGVDATVKALIWCPDAEGDEVDEGEGESPDVAPRQRIATTNASTTIPNNVTPSFSNTTNSSSSFKHSGTSSTLQNQNHGLNSSGLIDGNGRTIAHIRNVGNNDTSNPYQRSGDASNTNPYQRSSNPGNANPNQRNSNTNSVHPYDRSTSFHSNLQHSSEGTYNGHPPNQRDCALPINFSQDSSNNASQVSDITQSNYTTLQKAPNPYARTSPSRPPTVTPATAKSASTIPSSSTTQTTYTASQITNISQPNKGDESYSIFELKTLLSQISQNKTMYEQNYGKTFIVPCKMRSCGEERPVFNIIKVKKGKRGCKKHEFLFVCHFHGAKASDGHLSCRVESSLMEPYFVGHTPTDIRKLQKEEKERANKLVNDSSTQFLHEFSAFAEIHMKLLLDPEEFFGKISFGEKWMEDLNNPVLIAFDRKPSSI